MKIPQNVILIWPSTNSSIPSGWTRETSLDGKYPKAWGSEPPNTTGGAETHTHTSPPHYHTMVNHTHTYYTNPVGNNGVNSFSPGSTTVNVHRHKGTSGNVVGGETNSVSVIYGPCSNHPPYKKVIFIKAGLSSLLQNNIIALWAGWQGNNNPPNNWQECNGNNNSPDLRNKYIMGANTNEDAGGEGGSYYNIHDITHSHTSNPHSHESVTSGTPIRTDSDNPGEGMNGSGSGIYLHISHTHTVTLYSTSTSINNDSSIVVNCSEIVEPAYKKVMAIQFKTGAKKEKGIIGLWLGNINNIPKGWALCDGNNNTPDLRDKFIKIANNSSEIGQTGGSNTHIHTNTHLGISGSSHTHTGTVSNHVGVYGLASGSSAIPSQNQNHSGLQSCSSQTTSYNSAITTANSSDNQPPYRTVAYIQFQKETNTGALLSFFTKILE